jgi:hypothetical protein
VTCSKIRLGAKIIKLVDELDEPEVYVAKDLCIFMKEVGWKPDRTVINGNSIYNGTRNAIVSDHEQRPKQVLTINDKPFPVADLEGGVRGVRPP